MDMSRHEVIAELEGIKVQLETMTAEIPGHRKQLFLINERLSRVEEYAKAAHQRIDEFRHDVCFTIGMSTTVVGIFASLLTWALGGR